MYESMLSIRTYVIVCLVLILLTFLTVSVSFAQVEGEWHVALGLLIAIGKAALVALFFMHVIHSTALTRIVIAVACFMFSILIVLTLGDYFTRGLVPFLYGH